MKSWHIEEMANGVSLFCVGAFLALAHDYGLHSVFGFLTGFGVFAALALLLYALVTQTPPKGTVSYSIGGLAGVLVAFGAVQQGWMVLFILVTTAVMLLVGLVAWLQGEANEDLMVKEVVDDE